MAFSKVLTVTQISTYLKSIIEEDKILSSVFLTGEISNFVNHYKSGHFYFTLKDEKALIKCVMFKSSSQRVKFEPYNGMKVILHGKISLYEKDGQYQLYVDTMHPDGEGALNLAFEQLKNKLNKLGMFDEINKKKIPEYPEKIGVITSPTGAAVKDILTVLQRRFPCAKVYLIGVQVQGEIASEQISKAIEQMNTKTDVDVIILGRGGGSLEELWAFNEEKVARAIFESEIPIISAVGHETDFTIADFVADVRAATPSVAAEISTPDIFQQKMIISEFSSKIKNYAIYNIYSQKQYLDKIYTDVFSNPMKIIEKKKSVLDSLQNKLSSICTNDLMKKRNEFSIYCEKLDAMSPLKVLSRGYCVVLNENSVIKSTENLNVNDTINVLLSKGNLTCKIESIDEN